MSSDKFPVKTFNQLDTLYSHARDNNDFEKYWLPGIKDGHRLDVEELFSSLGKEQFEEDKNLTRLSNELEARGLEFKRNHILETEKFWEFNMAVYADSNVLKHIPDWDGWAKVYGPSDQVPH